jgi:hypothetical protein
MSEVVGLEALKAKLTAFDEALKAEMQKKLPELGRRQQELLVEVTPRSNRTGPSGKYDRRGSHLRDLLSSSDAVKLSQDKVEIGFVTLPLQKQGFYSLWVHFGRKAHNAGDVKVIGRDRRSKNKGLMKRARFKKTIGAMAAHLFFQVAFLRFRDQVKRERAVARIIAAARTGGGM